MHELKESVKEMGKAKDTEHWVHNIQGKMIDLEEQIMKGQNNYELVMRELAEVK